LQVVLAMLHSPPCGDGRLLVDRQAPDELLVAAGILCADLLLALPTDSVLGGIKEHISRLSCALRENEEQMSHANGLWM
jgi:hypothetical protein